MANHNVKIKISDGSEFALDRLAYAWIDAKECVNCGVCREYCPVEAISEQQREVCRICPGCATKPGLTFDEMSTVSAEHACTIGCPLGIRPSFTD
jgi:ferredoxin